MKSYVIAKEEIFAWINRLTEKNEVVGPVKHENFTKFSPIQSVEEIVWGPPQSVIPPKAYLYPQSEELLTYEFGSEEAKITTRNAVKERILFGVHPCDLNAIYLMDQVWAEKNPDENYLAKRKAATLIGVDCLQLCSPEAICLRLDGLDPKGRFDLFLTDMGKAFFVQAATPRGEALLGKLGKRPKAAELEKIAAIQKKRNKLFNREEKKLLPEYKDLPRLMKENYDHEEWEERGRRDYACGACNMVCPTCYCFDVQDYMDVTFKKGVRSRFWDGCMLEDFAKVASGENFRDHRYERLRHRTNRKLNYLFEKWGESFCTGCGRCIKACLTKIVSPLEIANAVYKKSRR